MNGMQGLFNMLGGGSTAGLGELLSPEQQRAIQQQSMMAMAAALLQAGGPSTTRTSLGQALGGAFQAGQGAMQTGQTNAVQQMLLGQKIQEAKDARERRQQFAGLFTPSAATPATPATPLTAEQALLASPSVAGQAGPTTQRAAMIGTTPAPAPAQAGMPSTDLRSFIASLPESERQRLSLMPEADALKEIGALQSAARKFGTPQNIVIGGQPRVVQFNDLGEMREVQGAQPYEASPTEIRTLQALGITPTLGGVTDLARARAVNVNMGGGGLNLTPAQKKIDEKFADTYFDWQTGGGADTVANLAQVGTVLQRLESGQPLTGPMIGIQPDFVLALTNPNAAGAKEQVQEVVQRNLRVVLGAQFTEKEGTQLINRAYNPTLPPEQNAARLRKLFQQMAVSAQQRQAMVEYYEANGTLQGYRGPQPKISDFYEALQERKAPKAGDVVGGFRFRGGNPNDEANWERAQ